MESYHTPQPAPVTALDPVQQAAWDGYVTLITTLLPTIRSGSEARPGELKTGWKQLRAAVEATGSPSAGALLAGLPADPTPDDLAPLTAELSRIAQLRTHHS
jgi:hypothetical protein